QRFCSCLFYFFFQAEDGIRDATVTGVQTCALPIFADEALVSANGRPDAQQVPRRRGRPACLLPRRPPAEYPRRRRRTPGTSAERSEERRVGKECRCGRAREPEEQKRKGRDECV